MNAWQDGFNDECWNAWFKAVQAGVTEGFWGLVTLYFGTIGSKPISVIARVPSYNHIESLLLVSLVICRYRLALLVAALNEAILVAGSPSSVNYPSLVISRIHSSCQFPVGQPNVYGKMPIFCNY